MAIRRRSRRGAVWTTLLVGTLIAAAATMARGLFLPGFLLVAVGLALAGPASRPFGRARSRRHGVEACVEAPRRRAIIVGAGEVAQSLARELAQAGGYEVIGFVEDQAAGDLRILGGRDDILALAEAYRADEIIIAEAPSWQQKLLEGTMGRGSRALEVKLVPSLYETAIGRLPAQRVKDIPLLSVSPWQRSEGYERGRRAFDVLFSGAALLITAPLLGLASLAIKLTSPGPVLFRQERVGRDGTSFVMLKLQSMILDAERDGPSLCMGYDDTRLTMIGRLLRKTRLDELPQFINVLRGEMSVIGPRPERPVFVEKFEREVPGYAERHRIRPGITGLAQVNGGYLSSARDKLRYDLFYLYHRSLALDLIILVRTFGSMIH